MKNNIKRRGMLISMTSVMAGIAGCSDVSSPSLVVSEVRSIELRFIEQNAESRDEYSLVVENTELSGSVRLKLYFADGNEVAPSPTTTTVTYLDSGERREITMSAEPPNWADGYEFDYTRLDFAADVTNEGADGDVIVRLREGGKDGPIRKRKTITMFADETRQIEFRYNEGIRGKYYIQAVPAQSS